jgi:hypothetical protein
MGPMRWWTMRRSSVLAVTILLLLTTAGVRPAEACLCFPRLLWDRATRSSDVFAGEVLGLQTVGPWQVFRVRVGRSWKGTFTSGTVVSIAVTDHWPDDTPATGETWVLFADRYAGRPELPRIRPELVTAKCSGNWRVTAQDPTPDFPKPPTWP